MSQLGGGERVGDDLGCGWDDGEEGKGDGGADEEEDETLFAEEVVDGSGHGETV